MTALWIAIDELNQAWGTEAASAAMQRFLRVPESLDALRDDDLRQRLVKHDPPPSLADLISQARVQAAEAGDAARLQPLLTVAQQADDLVTAASDDGSLPQALMADPIGLRSALACAFPQLQGNGQVLRELITSTDIAVRLSALNAALANMSAPDLAEWLAAQPVRTAQLAADLTELGELAIVRQLPDAPSAKTSTATDDSRVEQALRFQAQGDLESAIHSLQQAWEHGTEHSAGIADRLGAAASAAGDFVLAHQARQRAHDLRPSTGRAAELALALAEAGDGQGALALVNGQAEDRASLIAGGWANLRLGLPSEAHGSFERAESAAGLLSASWIVRLADGWLALGEMERSIRCLSGHCARRPADLAARHSLAERQLQAGEFAAAADGASLLAQVAPSNQALALRARALQASGHSKPALTQWLSLLPDMPEAKAQVALCAIEAGELETALRLAQELVNADPQSTEARVTMARALIASGNSRAGIAHLRRATELSPQSSLTWLALAQAEHEEGNSDRALDTLQSAAQACPDQPSVHLLLATYLAEQEQWTEALRSSEAAYDLDPDDPAALALHGTLLVRLGQTDSAATFLEQSIARQPGNWSARTELARLYQANGQLQPAADLMASLPEDAPASSQSLAGRILIQARPEDAELAAKALVYLDTAVAGQAAPELDYWRGRAYQALGEPTEALRSFQACLKALPDDSELYHDCLFGQAQAAIAADQTPVAISLLEQARERHQLPVGSLTLLSKAYLTAGLPDEALDPALEACQRDPADVAALNQVVAAASATGQTELAVAHLSRIDQQSPFDPEVQLALASQYAELEQTAKARSALAKAIWADRDSATVLTGAAATLLTLDQPQPAVRLLLSAERQAGANPALLAELARAATAAGDPQLARRVWVELLEIDPNSVEALVGAAEACWQLDQRTASIGYLQRAAATAPDRLELQTRLARAQLANGETGHAHDHYRTALRHSPSDQALRLEAARALMDQGAYADALQLVDGLPREFTSGADLRTLAATALLELDRPQEALSQLRKIGSAENGARQHTLQAVAYLATDQTAEVRASFDAARAIDPALTDAQPWAVQVAAALGDWQAMTEMLTLSPDDLDAALLSLATCLRLADSAHLIGRLGEASGHAPAPSILEICSVRTSDLSPDLFARLGAGPGLQASLEAWRSLNSDEAVADDRSFIQDLPAQRWIRGWAFESLALHRLQKSDWEGALEALAAGPPETQQGSWGALLAGLAHVGAGRLPMARKAYGAVSHGQLASLAAYLAGRSWADEGRLQEAINNLNSAVVAWPDEPCWQSRLAGLYLQAAKPEAALPHYQQAAEQAPHDEEALLGLARSFAILGQHSESLSAYQQLADQPAAAPHLLTEAGGQALTCGQPQQAAGWFARAIEGDERSVEALLGGARAAMQLNDRPNAESMARRALRHSPDDPNVLATWAEVLTYLDRKEQALAAFDEARKSADQLPSLERDRSRLLVRMGRAQDAIDGLQAIVEADPQDEQAWATLAEAYAASNRIDEAIDALRLALQIRPASIGHRLNLAQLFRKAGQLDQSLDELSKLETEAPNDYRVPLEIGLVHRARRQWGLAQRAFERAIDLRGDSAAAHFHAGMVLKALKSYAQAATMLQRAVALNPHDSEALQQLAAVQALELVHGGMQTAAVTS